MRSAALDGWFSQEPEEEERGEVGVFRGATWDDGYWCFGQPREQSGM